MEFSQQTDGDTSKPMSTGTVISGKYEIRKELKRGGFGIIYQGVDTNFGKTVAIKSIDPELLGEARYVDMFQHEALNIARLNHQNIVQLYDIRRGDNGQLYMVMEYIDGFDFMRVLRACRSKERFVPSHLAAYIVAEICNGLDYAHNRRNPETKEPLNLVHKDVSPVNIMIAKSGEVKLIDFGMADFLTNHKRKFNEVQIQGNIRYIAPEQARQAATLDRRTDIFALGVVLFEMLTGERLVTSNSKQEIVETLIIGNYDLTRLKTDTIPEKLQQITRKALQHNPANRYPTANDMYRDLMHYMILTAPTANFMTELVAFIETVDPVSAAEDGHDSEELLLDMDGQPQSHETTPEDGNGASAGPEIAREIPDPDGQASEETAGEAPVSATSDAPEQPAQGEETNGTDGRIFGGEEHRDGAAPGNASGFETQQEPLVESAEKTEQPGASDYYSFVEDEEDDNHKTIIDVVRLSARTHRKSIIIGAVTLFVSFLAFTVVDTFANFTPLGTRIYDFLFPPAIKIVSVPSDANVYLDDKLLPATTPLSLDEISPGVHKLMLTLPQYESIVKSINVPRKGELRLSGEAKRHAGQAYVLNFKNRLDIASQPAGANIIIDGIRLNQVTPATVFWDVSEAPSHIELELDGLPTLSGLSINSITGNETIADRRLWKVSKPIAGKAHYLIEGIFHKNITLTSTPRLADIYYSGSEKPVGVTGISGNMMLTVGEHNFTLRKEGWLPVNFSVTVDENTQPVIHHDLSRNVRIFAKDELSGDDRDLGANLISLTLSGKSRAVNRRTPAILQLLPYTYTAVLKKAGYHDLELKIKPDANSVVALMKPLYYELTIETIDAITSAPVRTAKISYRMENSRGPEEILGITDENGQINAKLMPGAYQVSVVKDGYQKQSRNIKLQADSMNRLTFRLTALR